MARRIVAEGRQAARTTAWAVAIGLLLMLASAGTGGSVAPAAQAQTAALAAWLELAPGGGVLARAVSAGPTCPTLLAGDARIQPAVRAALQGNGEARQDYRQR